MRRSICALAAAAGLAAGLTARADVTVRPLVMAGDAYDEFFVSTGFASVADTAVTNSGTWLVETAFVDGFNAIIRGTGLPPGVVIVEEGVIAPTGDRFDFFGRMSMNNAGITGFNADYVTTAAADSGIHYNVTTQVMLERSAPTAPQFSSGTIFIGFFSGLVNDDHQILVMASVDDPLIASTADRALIRVDNANAVATQTVLLKEGDEVVAGRLLVDFQTNPHTYTLAAGGRVLATPDMDGDGLNDSGLLYHNGAAWSFVAREGDPCPAVPGRNYGNFGFTNASDINNSGAWAARVTLDAPTTDDSVIIRNGTDVIAREGSPVPAVPGFSFTGFSSGAIKIDDSGNVFYFGQWNDPDTTRNTGLFRNGELLVQKGVTTLPGGDLLTDIAGVQDNFSISDNGRYLIFEGDLTDVNTFIRRGAIMVEISGCPADFNGQGGVTVQDIFDFLAAYFSSSPSADFNGQGGVTVQDIFDYLAAYFTPCS